MGHFRVDERDLFFILKQQLNYGRLCRLDRYRGLDEATLDLLVREAVRFASGVVAPLQVLGDRHGAVLDRGRVRTAPGFREAWQQFAAGGWIAVARDTRWGGQGFPHMMRIVVNDQMYGACQAFNMAPSLTHGAGHLIECFGTPALRELFVPPMYAGRWAGTMCLTEPEAGSSLGAIRTTAVTDGAHYRIRGTKTFISWGDHALTENIVHLVLARRQGAPAGVRGISLFVVPKMRVNPDGSLGTPNDVTCTGIENKLGLHGSPTCSLAFGERDACLGFLCGEANRGLEHMFQMVNQARINSAVSGMTLASLAYRNALDYAHQRRQGTDVAGRRPGQVPIIDHPDVRRMLLWMKAAVDGMRSLIYTAAFFSDLALELPPGPEKDHHEALLEFLTPLVKAYCSDTGFRVCETAIQCLGGYGYSRDYPLEQYLRDIKILSLYEGTNGIQSMDLLGRKMRLNHGAPFKAFMQEIGRFTEAQTGHPVLASLVALLGDVHRQLATVVPRLAALAASDPLLWAVHAYPGLVCLAEVAMAWRLLDLAAIAHRELAHAPDDPFLAGKVHQAAWFVRTTLPLTLGRLQSCLDPGREPVTLPDAAF